MDRRLSVALEAGGFDMKGLAYPDPSSRSSALAQDSLGRYYSAMTEIIFEVREDEVAGGYVASALGFGIHTQAETLEELRAATREATDCYFDETMDAPKVIRLHFVRDEVFAR